MLAMPNHKVTASNRSSPNPNAPLGVVIQIIPLELCFTICCWLEICERSKYIYPKKVTLNDAKDSVIDAKTNTPMLVEMAHKLRDEPVLGREPSSQPSVLVTPEQRPHIERHIFPASSVATCYYKSRNLCCYIRLVWPGDKAHSVYYDTWSRGPPAWFCR